MQKPFFKIFNDNYCDINVTKTMFVKIYNNFYFVILKML